MTPHLRPSAVSTRCEDPCSHDCHLGYNQLDQKPFGCCQKNLHAFYALAALPTGQRRLHRNLPVWLPRLGEDYPLLLHYLGFFLSFGSQHRRASSVHPIPPAGDVNNGGCGSMASASIAGVSTDKDMSYTVLAGTLALTGAPQATVCLFRGRRSPAAPTLLPTMELVKFMNNQHLCNRPMTVSYDYKKDAKGERHGTPASTLAGQSALGWYLPSKPKKTEEVVDSPRRGWWLLP